MSQDQDIRKAIMYFLDEGYTDKHTIYTKITENLKVPRPTVRRVARQIRLEFLAKISILQGDKN